MALNGNLSTMPLTDLLQWAGTTRVTGTLRVERKGVCKRIHFREGRVVGCSSDDPPALLGQFLIARGKIEPAHLKEALARQEHTDKNIGEILIEMDVLTPDALHQSLAAKAEETIFGMFDWNDAAFRFHTELEPDPYSIEVDLEVQDVVLRGTERQDMMNRFREVFGGEGVVLEHAGSEPPAEVMQSRMARRIYDSINGERTLAEIVLRSHASEYLVTKFLHQLHKMKYVRVKEVREIVRETESSLERDIEAAIAAAATEHPAVEPAPARSAAPPPAVASPVEPVQAADVNAEDDFEILENPTIEQLEELDRRATETGGGADEGLGSSAGEAAKAEEVEAKETPAPMAETSVPRSAAEAGAPRPAAPAGPGEATPTPARVANLAAEIAVAVTFMGREEYEAALTVLQASQRNFPEDTSLQQLIARAEAALEKSHLHELAPQRIPRLLYPAESISNKGLSPEASFLPSLIDGKTDIKSLLWLAPMRSVDVLRALKQMLDKGLIELVEPEAEGAEAAAS